MSQLSDELYERFSVILTELTAVRAKVSGRSKDFLDDQIERLEKYGRSIFLSPKQRDWLESLYEQHVGPLSGVGTVDQGDAAKVRPARSNTEDDIDDTIPF